jgi:hypothetical protein
VLLLALSASFGVACSDDDPIAPPSSPLDGLVQVEERDSTGAIPVPPGEGGPLEPGIFRGRVLGQADPGVGDDTLETAPRLGGVEVTAYELISSNGGVPNVGPEVASVVTGSDGTFQFPELPGGEYVVTFEPPQNSIYRGVWVTAIVHSGSGDLPWWIVLQKK